MSSQTLNGLFLDFGGVKSIFILTFFSLKNLSQGHLGDKQQIEKEKKYFLVPCISASNHVKMYHMFTNFTY